MTLLVLFTCVTILNAHLREREPIYVLVNPFVVQVTLLYFLSFKTFILQNFLICKGCFLEKFLSK